MDNIKEKIASIKMAILTTKLAVTIALHKATLKFLTVIIRYGQKLQGLDPDVVGVYA